MSCQFESARVCEVMDQLSAMLNQEASKYQPMHARQEDSVSASCRRKLFEWSFNVVDHFGIDREVVSVAANYTDRYIATGAASGHRVDRKEFQLVCVTSLYLAVKLHGDRSNINQRSQLSLSTFAEFSRGLITVESLEEMELKLMAALGYLLHPPTASNFVEYLLHLLLPMNKTQPNELSRSGVDDNTAWIVFETARYITELAVFDLTLSSCFKQSEVAFASILLATEAVRPSAFPASLKEMFLLRASNTARLQPNEAGVQQAKAILRGLCPSNVVPGHEQPISPGSLYTTSNTSTGERDKTISHSSPVCVGKLKY